MDHGELSALRQAEHEQRVLAEARERKLESLEAQLKELLADENSSSEDLAAKTNELQTALQAIGQAAYAAAGPASPEPGADGEDGEDGGDDEDDGETVEGEFREV